MSNGREYSADEINQLVKLRKEGKSFKEIAAALGRGHQGVQFKYKALIKEKRPGAGKRIYRRRSRNTEVLAGPTPRPMVAFIGNHSEITTAIKELFS